LENNTEKANLRKVVLEKRDSLSYDFIEIASKKIHKNLNRCEPYQNAKTIASYFPIGSEVKTQEIMQEILQQGKTLGLPKVVGEEVVFKKITDSHQLEKGSFGIMEPKEDCQVLKDFDVILVPSIGITRNGVRLGHGYGFYDKALFKSKAIKIALVYSRQIIKSIPKTELDVTIDWIITEEERFETSKIG